MAGFAVSEVPRPVFPALHPERRRHDAVEHLPKRGWLVIDWIVHKSLFSKV